MWDLEHEIQVKCVNKFRELYPSLTPYLFAIPNGGKRHKTTARKLKKEGTRRGVYDLFLAYPLDGFSGLWLEMKRPKVGTRRAGTLSKEQKQFKKDMDKVGFKCVECWSLKEFLHETKIYLSKK